MTKYTIALIIACLLSGMVTESYARGHSSGSAKAAKSASHNAARARSKV